MMKNVLILERISDQVLQKNIKQIILKNIEKIIQNIIRNISKIKNERESFNIKNNFHIVLYSMPVKKTNVRKSRKDMQEGKDFLKNFNFKSVLKADVENMKEYEKKVQKQRVENINKIRAKRMQMLRQAKNLKFDREVKNIEWRVSFYHYYPESDSIGLLLKRRISK